MLYTSLDEIAKDSVCVCVCEMGYVRTTGVGWMKCFEIYGVGVCCQTEASSANEIEVSYEWMRVPYEAASASPWSAALRRQRAGYGARSSGFNMCAISQRYIFAAMEYMILKSTHRRA